MNITSSNDYKKTKYQSHNCVERLKSNYLNGYKYIFSNITHMLEIRHNNVYVHNQVFIFVKLTFYTLRG